MKVSLKVSMKAQINVSKKDLMKTSMKRTLLKLCLTGLLATSISTMTSRVEAHQQTARDSQQPTTRATDQALTKAAHQGTSQVATKQATRKGPIDLWKAIQEPKADAPTSLPSVDDLPVYNPQRDQAPKEHVPIKETNFTFSEPLLVRPATDHIVIHHVGLPSGDYSAEKIHKYHQEHNGWAGIGYQYVIRRDGTIERGRPLAAVGAQAQGENLHTVGICLAGNFNEEKVDKKQYQSLVKLVANLAEIYHLPLTGEIVGHRDYNDTTCPGTNLYDMLPQLREDVRKQVAKDKKNKSLPHYETKATVRDTLMRK